MQNRETPVENFLKNPEEKYLIKQKGEIYQYCSQKRWKQPNKVLDLEGSKQI